MATPRKIAIPAARSSAATLAVRKRLFMGLLIAAIVFAVLSPLLSWKLGSDPAPTQAGVDSRIAAVAEQAGRDFLAGRNSTVPAADGVNTNWSGEETPKYTAEDLKDPANIAHQANLLVKGVSGLEVTSFALQGDTVTRIGDHGEQLVHHVRFRVTLNSAPYLLTVPVIDDARYGTVIGGEPALMPGTTGKRDVAPLDYKEGFADSGTDLVTDAVTKSVTEWAEAYAAGGANDNRLRKVVDDQDASRTYNGLGGWYAQVSGIVNAVPVGGANTGKPKGLIVQAQVNLSRTPFAETSAQSLGSTPSATNGFSLSTTYDLYVVTEGNPANPPVVAWGAAGAVKDLIPYSNAN